MFLRKNWLPISIFIVLIGVLCLYLLQTQPEKEPIKVYKLVEVEKSTQQPTASPKISDTSQAEPNEVFVPSRHPHRQSTETPTDTNPLEFITFEEYEKQISEWKNQPLDKWGFRLTSERPKPPGQVGKWKNRDEKEKASDLWWEMKTAEDARVREVYKRMKTYYAEKDRQNER